ncbi:uracil DNA glycosylase [Marasmius tenuissimus]|uniref:Uracil DNA glycosylase n=1 Tax=Marasmius tenuissimus TaxID=585030 RepID=A0ABR3AB33_9AGAR
MPKDLSKDSETAMIRTEVTRVSRRVASTSTTQQVKETKRKSSTTKKVASSVAGSSTDTDVPDLNATTASQLASLEQETMGQSWYDALEGEFDKSYFKKVILCFLRSLDDSQELQLKSFLETELKSNTVFPPLKNIYSWSRLTPLDSVKVVILGQDPYHNVGQAHGLSFSVLPPTKPPGSLKNIYKQIAADVPSFVIPKTSGDLTKLAELGVLWLNTALTVRAHKAGSHSGKGWENLTLEAVKTVMNRENSNGVVFMAWGLPAQKTCQKLGIDEVSVFSDPRMLVN